MDNITLNNNKEKDSNKNNNSKDNNNNNQNKNFITKEESISNKRKGILEEVLELLKFNYSYK